MNHENTYILKKVPLSTLFLRKACATFSPQLRKDVKTSETSENYPYP